MHDDRVIIEADKPLSQSLIWEIQRQYFMDVGIDAWRKEVVPHQISCNPYLARAYGDVILGYVRDCVAAGVINRQQPLFIIELGAGSGRLTHHLIHQFYPRFLSSSFADLQLTFVLTDFVPEIVEFWCTHEKLRPWVDQNLLDFALFDVTAMEPLTLIESGQTLTIDAVQNPLILLANYFFDSIPQDSFVIEDGELQDNLLTLTSIQQEPRLHDPTIWERLLFEYDALPLQEPYQTAVYNDILVDYEATLPDTVFSFPTLGLDCIRFWEQFGKSLWLTADRGYAQLESLIGQGAPLPNLHGSFSMMVNYHAMNEYVWRRGGTVLQADHYQNNLQVLGYILGDIPHGGRNAKLAFEASIAQGGPDDYFGIRQLLASQFNNMDLSQLLSLLRWSRFDADLFRESFAVLIERVQEADEVWYEDVKAVVQAVHEQYLPLSKDDDLKVLVETLADYMSIRV